MILLSDWANFRKSGVEVSLDDDEANTNSDECNIADVVQVLIDNVQLASRLSQAQKSRGVVQEKLDVMANQMVTLLQNNIAGLRTTIDRQLAALFFPLLNERLEAKAIADFCSALVTAIEKDAARQLVITAPMELHERLAARLGEHEINAGLLAGEGENISTSFETTEITTEIGKWKADLQRLLS